MVQPSPNDTVVFISQEQLAEIMQQLQTLNANTLDIYDIARLVLIVAIFAIVFNICRWIVERFIYII